MNLLVTLLINASLSLILVLVAFWLPQMNTYSEKVSSWLLAHCTWWLNLLSPASW